MGTDSDLTSLGLSLTDTLDDLINEGRIEPQLAMKILSTFDKVVTEVLAEKVRARLTFKVSFRKGSIQCTRPVCCSEISLLSSTSNELTSFSLCYYE